MNRLSLSGFISKDPVQSFSKTNKEISRFGIAVQDLKNYDQRYFFNVIAFKGKAEFANTHLKKGQAVNIDARLVTREVKMQNGQMFSIQEIVADTISIIGASKKLAEEKDIQKKVDEYVSKNIEEEKNVSSNELEITDDGLLNWE